MEMTATTQQLVGFTILTVSVFLLGRRGNAVVRRRFAMGLGALAVGVAFSELSIRWHNAHGYDMGMTVIHAEGIIVALFYVTGIMLCAAGAYVLHKGGRAAPA